ncbi:MAG: BatA domain-containing protein [Bacteroidetes bacterium]|nr:BatA domain-containing protein [Bacteroidota bacterium]
MNISFVTPGFLFALSLIAVPVIIHLFNFRRFRKVYFTNVRFLKELKEETSNRSRLKHLLVLFSRILAVTFMVLAFAQPYIPAEQGKKIAASTAVSLYVDNSFSMEAVTREGTLLDVAKKQAASIAMAYRPSDRFQLLTNDFDPVHQRLVSRDEFISLLDQVKISPVSRSLTSVLSRQADALGMSGAEEKKSVLLSDFQTSISNFEQVQMDSSIAVAVTPIAAQEVSNIFIDSCWFTAPVVQKMQPAELNISIRNNGQIDAEALPVKLTVNGAQKAVAGANVNAGNSAVIKLTFTPSGTGWQKAVVSITDNPITFDDQYYFSFLISENVPILSINGARSGPYVKALFGSDSYFKLSEFSESQPNYSSFSENKLIVMNQVVSISSGFSSELNRFVNAGGSLVIIPDSASNLLSYSECLTSLGMAPLTGFIRNEERIESLQLEDPVFDGVFSNAGKVTEATDLPLVSGYFVSGNAANTGDVLMKLRSGAPFLTRFQKGKGTVYLFHSPFTGSLTNFARHAIFVPVMYRIALLSEKQQTLAGFIGVDETIDLQGVSVSGDEVFHLINESNNFDIIPGHRTTTEGTLVDIKNQVVLAGNYDLKANDRLLAVPAFNFNRSESDMSFFTADQISEALGKYRLSNFELMNAEKAEIVNHFSQLSEGIRLWKYCIILALLFLAIEVLLLKFWRK